MKKIVFAVVITAVAGVQAAISDVSIVQRWPWSPEVDISYVLSGDADRRYDIIIEAKNGDEALQLSVKSLSGDVQHVAPGVRRLTWNPAADGYTNTVLPRFNVKLSERLSPVYMIVDLATGAKEYRYETGNWEGVNDVVYKTDKMVFKRVCAGSFKMGSSYLEVPSAWMAPHDVTLTEDYWLGVFEVTQAQYNKLTDAWPSYSANVEDRACRPVESVSFATVRGSSSAERFNCKSTSFVGLLAAKASLRMDLPTEAQIEYAQRAGDQRGGDWYQGAKTDAEAASCMRFDYNGTPAAYKALSDADKRAAAISVGGTAEVGHFPPNAWGFYDLADNVWELTVDAFGLSSETVTDPYYPIGTGKRMSIHGGCYTSVIGWCKNCTRSDWGVFDTQNDVGFRLMAEVER